MRNYFFIKRSIKIFTTCILLITFILTAAIPNTQMADKKYSYLALGDSYTIGESISIMENFPSQTVQLLRNSGYDFRAPEIIAKTGWTTMDLTEAIQNTKLLSSYDFITLLIGVNNQFQGLDINEYKKDFETLLKTAISLAGDKSGHVIVLSVPDWGATPFAEDRLCNGTGKERKQISTEIDEYNMINQLLSRQYKVHYIDITPGTREAAKDETLLSNDKLHPSRKEYARWATPVFALISNALH
jgi:lysophospholipase L1-like esterase